MKILVCVRQGADGGINPFDACAYEEALRVDGAEVILLSMGPASTKEFLLDLTRRGAGTAVLLTDTAFAGADTLATAYTLSLAVKKIAPDYVFCGRQTLIGDTAQTGPMLSVFADRSLITNVMEIRSITSEKVVCATREQGVKRASAPALLTIERINSLRLPRLRSKVGQMTVWSAQDVEADVSRCGLKGSPTRVLQTFENASGRRRCRYIFTNELDRVIEEALQKQAVERHVDNASTERLPHVWVVGDDALTFAHQVGDDVRVIERSNARTIAKLIQNEQPNAVLWGSDSWSKQTSAQVAAMLQLGLCADCTSLETDGEKLIMYRPALSGSVLAKIVSLTRPAMATVRTAQVSDDVYIAVGYGARAYLKEINRLAKKYNATVAATRKMVDNDLLPYDLQVGLTGKSVSPSVYIALGVSGAVHHIVGMQRAGTVIAVNSDKEAPIFDYADYGIVADVDMLLH